MTQVTGHIQNVMSKTSASAKRNGSRSRRGGNDTRRPNGAGHELLPSDVSHHVGPFDRFAQWASQVASRAVFFVFCVLMILVWAPTIFLLKFDTSQLLINTSTTIITFLMVALLQNSQSRAEKAIQHKLNAIADSLADHMENSGRQSRKEKKDAAELREAVGLEFIESSDE